MDAVSRLQPDIPTNIAGKMRNLRALFMFIPVTVAFPANRSAHDHIATMICDDDGHRFLELEVRLCAKSAFFGRKIRVSR